MSYWVYSSEPIPNTNLLLKSGKGFLPGYTPEYIQYGGITLPNIPGGKWMALPDSFPTIRHKDWTDRAGEEGELYTGRIVARVRSRPGIEERGIIFIDHEPSEAEKRELEATSKELNMEFRKRVVDEYESQVRDRQVTGFGRSKPTPYEDECYSILGIKKPYSVEAFIAERQPGEEAAKRIGEAIERALSRRLEEPKPEAPVSVEPGVIESQPQPERKGWLRK